MSQGNVAGNRVFKIAILWEHLQQRCQTGFHVREETLLNTNPDEIRTDVVAWVTDHMRPVMTSFHRLIRVDVTSISDGAFARHEFANVVGSQTPGAALAPHRAVGVNLRSASRFRWRNGRMSWPLCLDSHTANGVMTGTGVTAYTAALTAFTTAFIGVDVGRTYRACVLSRGRDAADVVNATARSWIDVDSAILQLRETTMNTRKIGRGA